MDGLPPLTALDCAAEAINIRILIAFKLSEDIPEQQLTESIRCGLECVRQQHPTTGLALRPNKDAEQPTAPYAFCHSSERSESNFATASTIHYSSDLKFDQLESRGWPMDMLDGDLVAPDGYLPREQPPWPAFGFRATRIDGGLILCFLGHHLAFDGTGLAMIISAFADGCRDAFDARPGRSDLGCVSEGGPTPAAARKFLLELGSTHSPGKVMEDSNDFIKDIPAPESDAGRQTSPSRPSRPSRPRCLIASISPKCLQRLKAVLRNVPATNFLSSSPAGDEQLVSSLSTFTAISALLTVCMARVAGTTSSSSLVKPNEMQLRITIPIDCRSRLNHDDDLLLLSEYTGNCVICAIAKIPMRDVVVQKSDEQALQSISRLIRRALDSVTAAQIREVLSRGPVRVSSDITLALTSQGEGPVDTGQQQEQQHEHVFFDFSAVSWLRMGLYDLDFGFGLGLGRPTAVRIPKTAWSGAVVILPIRRDGSVEVTLGLDEGQIQALRACELWTVYMREIPG